MVFGRVSRIPGPGLATWAANRDAKERDQKQAPFTHTLSRAIA
jgi:hypothetical protein